MATSSFSQPIYNPRFRAFTAAGVPLSGGKLNTYVGGTVNTPLATYPTYADALAGTNANANPIILDANGECTAFGINTLYKFVLTDSVNVTQWTIDNVLLGDVPRSATTVVKNGTQTGFGAVAKVTTWTVELDSLNEWSAGNNRWVATYPGKFLIELSAEMTDTTINSAMTLAIFKNGAQVGRTINRSSATASQVWGYHAHYLGSMVATDFIEVFVTGTANTAVQTGVGTRLSVVGFGA